MHVRNILPILFLLLAVFWPGAASAESVELRSHFCHANAPADRLPNANTVRGLSFDCSGGKATGYHDRWLWLRLDTSRLAGPDAARVAALPVRWRLLIDQARFDRIAIVIIDSRGRAQEIVRDAGDLEKNWAPGGLQRFVVDRAGRDVRQIHIGYYRLADLGLMRKVTAASPETARKLSDRWLLLMGLFSGALLSAFAYNLVIYIGHRQTFQRWYLIWAATVLAYGLIWTNVIALLLPGFVGPVTVRLDFILVGVMIGTGNVFFLAVIEEGVLPRWLHRAGRVLALIGILLGAAASADQILPAALMDRLMNYAILASAISVFIGVCYAIRRGSRIVWFYLLGWTPVLVIFALRLARNLGFLPQNDLVDLATFGTLAFESIALSLAIADRFRLLRRERDLAEQARAAIAIESETLRRAAQTDFLTGLGNRASFQAALRTCMESSARGIQLYLIDVDNLKEINDRLGHDGGDALLVHVGEMLRGAVGTDEHVARIGGDEFALILTRADERRIAEISETLDMMQGEIWSYGGRSWALSLSIGMARYPEDALDADPLYKNADLALYEAKLRGRRRLHRYDPGLRAEIDRSAALARDAHLGLERDEFVLHYQPIVELEGGRVVSYEALLRWQHPEHGVLTPSVFGSVLVDPKIGSAVQDRVLTRVLAMLAARPDDIRAVSMNFTAAQLDGAHAARRLLSRLEEAGVAPERLCIEVTEDIVLGRSVDAMAEALRLLHEANVQIALDDFGTGYASLIHLKRMPIDILKIDRSFVLSLFDGDGSSEAIVRAIIGLGRGMRKSVIAEGIETVAQRQRLIELGCTLGQGYLFARPGPLDDLR
ncbi:MAG: putative bifunctional diguanylate cyclase/phosphodiesterase [Sphingobium sp.]